MTAVVIAWSRASAIPGFDPERYVRRQLVNAWSCVLAPTVTVQI
jgi:hypothetical protein